MSVRYLQVLV